MAKRRARLEPLNALISSTVLSLNLVTAAYHVLRPAGEAGDLVNVERALPADGRNSGHFVQGHVDDIGIIEELRPDGDSLWVRVRPPARLMPYIVPKGFIAIDGTSLTVCNVNAAEGWFDFMLIAFTQQKVVIPKKAVGDAVNLEVDVLAKYVEQGLKAVTARLDVLEAKLAKQ